MTASTDPAELRLEHEEFGDLPLGWGQGRLGKLGAYVNGRAFKSSEWAESGLPIIRIQNLTGSSDTQNYYQGDLDPKHSVAPGDLLISWAATLGVYKWDGPHAALNQHIFKVESHIDQDFHYHLVRFILAELEQATHGSGMEHITKTAFEAVEVPIPPLAEQRRIAKCLSEVSSRVSQLTRRVEGAAGRIARLRRGVLAAGLSGQLTRRWREERYGEPDVPDFLPPLWQEVSCGELVDGARALTYGVIKLGKAVPKGVPVLRSSNVRFLRIDDRHVKAISPTIAADYTRTKLRGGEVLVTVRGSLGGVAVAPARMRGWNVSREVAVVPLRDEVEPAFVALAIAAPPSQRWLRDVSVGVAYTGINIRDLKKLPIPLPPLEEQREVVRRVHAMHQSVDDLEAVLSGAAKRVAGVNRSALSKAFRGELVPTEHALSEAHAEEFESGEALVKRLGAQS